MAPTPPAQSTQRPPNILYVHSRDDDEEYHYSDETNDNGDLDDTVWGDEEDGR